jgi:CBS domain-containing protein
MTISTILKAKGNAVVTIDPGMPVMRVAKTLADHKIGAVVVVDGAGAVQGIVSERDIVLALAAGGVSRLEAPASAIMTSPVITCQPTDTVNRIMSEMTARRFRHFPVVEKGNLVGIVSIGDIVKMRIADAEMETAAMRDYITTG